MNANIDWAQIESLAAEIVSISKAQITTANINEANIDWAAITTLSAAVASMVKADIGTADIDWAHIKDLATDTAIITQGVGGELYIAKLAVTEANDYGTIHETELSLHRSEAGNSIGHLMPNANVRCLKTMSMNEEALRIALKFVRLIHWS